MQKGLADIIYSTEIIITWFMSSSQHTSPILFIIQAGGRLYARLKDFPPQAIPIIKTRINALMYVRENEFVQLFRDEFSIKMFKGGKEIT